MAAATSGAASSGTNAGDRPEHELGDGDRPRAPSRPRRTIRRSHRRRRCGGERGADRVERRVERAVEGLARIGRDERAAVRRPAPVAARRGRGSVRLMRPARRCPRAAPAAEARRSRQRRVGETSWTDRAMKTTDRTSQVDDALRPEPIALGAERPGRRSRRSAARLAATHGDAADRDRCPLAAEAAAVRGTGITPPSRITTPLSFGTSAVDDLAPAAAERRSVPHSTSAWATNGLSQASTAGVRIPSTPGRWLPLSSTSDSACQKTSTNDGPDGDRQHAEERDRGRRGRALHEAEQNSPKAPEADGRDEQHDVAADHVVRADAAEHEHEGHQRDRGDDQQEDLDQRREQLAEDDRQRRDRRRDQQVEGLLLALER